MEVKKEMLKTIDVRLSQLLNLKPEHVINTIKLLDEGATVPFIARYRKEVTGGMSDVILRDFVANLTYMRELDDRRSTILSSIEEQGKLTDELRQQILEVDNKTKLEDLYLPYKPKRRTKAQIAREAGLEPLALLLLENQDLTPEVAALDYISLENNILDKEAALEGASYILIEKFSENAEVLEALRQKLYQEGLLVSEVIEAQKDNGIKFQDYFNYSELIKTIPSHRMLAVLRGVNEGILSMKLTYPEEAIIKRGEISSYEEVIINAFSIDVNKNAGTWLKQVVRLAFRAKIFVSLENELINKVRESAEAEAIKVFGLNLQNLLLQAPAGSKTTLGLDPGIRTGVKCALISTTGAILKTLTIYPFAPHNQYDESINILRKITQDYKVELIAIGNGTASRETEKLVDEVLKAKFENEVSKVVVSEAGASVYSASSYASQELPDLDVSLRGAVSIARRLQDPLAELVKIDPKSIGVGQYQHDVNQVQLSNTLNDVVEDCVNKVGVDVNTASVALLTYISGLNNTIAANIVNYRNEHGAFLNREQLKKVSRLGEKTFEQCAGFLRIINGDNCLDSSSVHPESYPLVGAIANMLKTEVKYIIGNKDVLKAVKLTEFVKLGYGMATIQDIIQELEKPGRDPRGEFKMASFKDDINTIEDLTVGIELEGVITNVTNFGAFVDIGVHLDGLVHVSEIANKFVSNPNEVLKVGQIVKVKVIEVDVKRKRISLSMKQTENNFTKPSGPKQNSPRTTLGLAFEKFRAN